jgi:esterase
MLVLHGLLGSARNWLSTGRDMAKHFHVLAPDARNHGKSPHAPEMNYDVMVADLLAWMDAQGLARATMVGHSMGGKTAMLLACRHPERVERLVVVDIAPKDYGWAAHRAEFSAMAELDLGSLQSRHEAELRFEARVPHPGTRKFLVTNLARGGHGHGPWHWAINLPVLTAALPRLEQNCLRPGDHALIRKHFPAARIEVIAGSGHNPHMDHREEFVRLVAGG